MVVTLAPAEDRIGLLVDDASFVEIDAEVEARVVEFAVPVPHRSLVDRAYARTGRRESVVTGFAQIEGHDVAIGVFEFGFLGGTLGVASGQKLVHLISLATERRLPLVVRLASGGVRVQEGVAALFQMASVGAAAAAHRAAKLLQIAVLDDPTTGGVAAGFGMAFDITVAERGARVSVAGGRTAESLGRSGTGDVVGDSTIDLLVSSRKQRSVIARLLDMMGGQTAERPSGWGTSWPETLADDALELAGDPRGLARSAVRTGVGSLSGRPFLWVVLSDDRGLPDPPSFAKARARLEWAARIGLPVVSLIDTAGADVSFRSERANLAGEIALTLAQFTQMPTPTMAVITGIGGSGPAMALAAADRLLMTEQAEFYPLAPVAVATLFGAADVEAVRSAMRTTAADHYADGIVDEVIPAGNEALRRAIKGFLEAPPSALARSSRWAVGATAGLDSTEGELTCS